VLSTTYCSPGWRNWQTQRTQNPPVLSTMGVQLPLPAPPAKARCKNSLLLGSDFCFPSISFLTMPKTMPVLWTVQFLYGVTDVGLGDNCVTLKYTSGAPTPYFHDHSLGSSCTAEIPGCCSPEVME
jgi:hypothetical protein